jgi:hypothetical protein
MAKKLVDMDLLVAEVSAKMAGKTPSYALPPGSLSAGKDAGLVDTSQPLSKLAAQALSPILDEAYPSSVKMENVDHKVLNPQDRQKAFMDFLAKSGKKASFHAALNKLAASVAQAGNSDLAGKVAKLAQEFE